MNKKSIENEAKRISNELLKKNNYNESFDDLINSLIKKKYINNMSIISYNVTKISKNEIFFVFLGDFV